MHHNPPPSPSFNFNPIQSSFMDHNLKMKYIQELIEDAITSLDSSISTSTCEFLDEGVPLNHLSYDSNFALVRFPKPTNDHSYELIISCYENTFYNTAGNFKKLSQIVQLYTFGLHNTYIESDYGDIYLKYNYNHSYKEKKIKDQPLIKTVDIKFDILFRENDRKAYQL